MKRIHIKQKLEDIGVALDEIVMGDFDKIGEFTAKRVRSNDDPNYKKYGAIYRANYERGILIYNLIRRFNLTSFLEIGFGRGYATMCAAKAFYDGGIVGKITSIDPNFDEKFIAALGQIFPKEWFNMIELIQGESAKALPEINEKYDLIYIDGDHSYEGTKSDWELSREKWNKFLLFDDYHEPSKKDSGIQCSRLIDEIDWEGESAEEPELIILDRRMFFDDRRFTDDQIDYGQVLFTRKGVKQDEEW